MKVGLDETIAGKSETKYWTDMDENIFVEAIEHL